MLTTILQHKPYFLLWHNTTHLIQTHPGHIPFLSRRRFPLKIPWLRRSRSLHRNTRTVASPSISILHRGIRGAFEACVDIANGPVGFRRMTLNLAPLSLPSPLYEWIIVWTHVINFYHARRDWKFTLELINLSKTFMSFSLFPPH